MKSKFIVERELGKPYEEDIELEGTREFMNPHLILCKLCNYPVRQRVTKQKYQKIPNPEIFGKNAQHQIYEKVIKRGRYICCNCDAESNRLTDISYGMF